MNAPDFSLPDPQRAEFEKRYKGMKRPFFSGGDVTNCRPMTKLELQQYREWQSKQDGVAREEVNYQMPF